MLAQVNMTTLAKITLPQPTMAVNTLKPLRPQDEPVALGAEAGSGEVTSEKAYLRSTAQL
jgi:hypothetical protein